MSKNLSAFYVGLLCALIYVEAVTPSEVEITFKTLKSDLDLILKDVTTNPHTVNIQYTKGAVLRMSILPYPGAKHGKYIKIDGTLTIKLSDGSVENRNSLEYSNDSFGLPTDEEQTSYIIIKENSNVEIKPADKTIQYISVQQLSDDLNGAKKHNKWMNVYKRFFCPDFPLGELTTTLIYDWAEEYLLFSRPLKGITLRGVQHRIVTLLERNWYERGSLGCECPEVIHNDGFVNTNTPEVFFDVWFALGSRRYGSSTGSLGCVDAVRIYEEWSQDVPNEIQAPVETQMKENRGDKIRERVFDQDMTTAYQLLQSEPKKYDNFVINYADEIVVEVRAGIDGGQYVVRATGTTKAGSIGRKPRDVRAFYDLEKLEYDQVQTDEEFVLENYGDKSSYLKYVDWSKFESHLKGLWKAMQLRGCTQETKQSYAFSIFYGESIRLKYDCKAKNVVLTGTIYLLTEVPGLKRTVISKCNNLRYTNKQNIELRCAGGHDRVIAIQQQPEKLWMKFDNVKIIHGEVFKNEMKKLRETLIKNVKSRERLTKGTIILDDDMLFEMKLPKGNTRPKDVEVYGNFTQEKSKIDVYKKLIFNGEKIATGSISIGTFNDVFINKKYVPFKYYSEGELVIAWKYLTIKSLQYYLQKVSAEAFKRCFSTKTSFSFTLVQHHTFELRGSYDCSDRVFLIEGNFRALILTKKDVNTEVRSDRVIRDFVYIENDNFFIPGSYSFDDVYAISLPEMTDSLEAIRESFGAPIQIDKNSILLLKSKQI